MSDLFSQINTATQILASVQASALESSFLRSVTDRLSNGALLAALKVFWEKLPVEPEADDAKDDYRKVMAGYADQLNRAAEPFLQELERIKRMRQTLNLEALDPVIREARSLVHRIHDTSAKIQGF